jgi:hypothetical protein
VPRPIAYTMLPRGNRPFSGRRASAEAGPLGHRIDAAA